MVNQACGIHSLEKIIPRLERPLWMAQRVEGLWRTCRRNQQSNLSHCQRAQILAEEEQSTFVNPIAIAAHPG